LVKIRAVHVIRGAKNLKKLGKRLAPNKTRGQSHQKTGKSVDAPVAVPLQRRFTLKLHPHQNDP